MKAEPPKNVPASVRQRLLNRAKNEERPFSELLQYYAMERFLYRLSKAACARRFILKGALMLRAWHSPEFRPTMDIDLLGMTSNEEARIIAQIQEVLAVEVAPDGLDFEGSSLQAGPITEDADYEGIRIRFRGALDSARIDMQIDIGFGDAIFPEPQELELPTMLEGPAAKLLCYSRESVIAEKFETMLKHGELNSRMKDFYDIWLLSTQFFFEGARLSEAIRQTLERRGTELPLEIPAFTVEFATGKQTQWMAFRKRLRQTSVPVSFAEVVDAVRAFLDPIVSGMASRPPTPMKWTAPGPWVQG